MGRLLPGYHADLVVLRLERHRRPYRHPATDPVRLALAQGRVGNVDAVMVGGEVLVEDGNLTRLDEPQLEEELAAACRAAERRSRSDPAALVAALTPYLRRLHGVAFSGAEPSGGAGY